MAAQWWAPPERTRKVLSLFQRRIICGCAALLLMAYVGTFSYQGGANPPIDWIRLLVSDTQQFSPVDGTTPIFAFWDEEIQAATAIEMAVWQSGMFWSGPQGLPSLPNTPVPWRRIAATLIDSLASNQARLSIISQQLDTKLNAGAVKDMMAQAAALREADDNSGAFAIVEQTNDWWSFVDRYWKTVQRQSGGFPG